MRYHWEIGLSSFKPRKSYRPSLACGEREASTKSDFAYLDVPLRSDTSMSHLGSAHRRPKILSVVAALYTTRDRCNNRSIGSLCSYVVTNVRRKNEVTCLFISVYPPAYLVTAFFQIDSLESSSLSLSSTSLLSLLVPPFATRVSRIFFQLVTHFVSSSSLPLSVLPFSFPSRSPSSSSR